MASASLHLLPPLTKFWSSIAPFSHHHTHQITPLTSLRFTTASTTSSSTNSNSIPKPLSVRFAVTESDSPKSIEPDPRALLQDIADSFDLPSDYFAQLPRDLRLDLNDAAFDLSNGPVLDECGQELGEILLNVSRAWELADTSTSHSLVAKLPSMEANLTGCAKSALGKRLLSAGRRFRSMGQYGQGEPQKDIKLILGPEEKAWEAGTIQCFSALTSLLIAIAMIAAGRALSASSASAGMDERPKEDTRTLKFGELQVEIKPDKANIGAVIGVVFGILSWEIAQGIENIPESSLQYANDNALLLAKSLRGALLAIFYSSTFLSAFTTLGLVLLGIQLRSKKD